MHKNRVTLNGVRSDLIEGLLIQELPPIIKPQMRSQIEEVDGMDGSIVTYLGFSAYEREMVIGLYGNYDIDQVIRFFNSDGEAIFSNEPDKVYHYTIINNIDFERLARFKTAVVTFYVQPFKHSSVDTEQRFTSSPCRIVNKGNVVAKPVVTITGSGSVSLSVNGEEVLLVELGNSQRTIIIDAEDMEAYFGDEYLNRLVAGNYNDLAFRVGENVLSWSGGTISSVKIKNYSRWI